MKLIIAGGRDLRLTIEELNTYIISRISTYNFIKEVVCGEAKGVDTTGKMWAQMMGIPVIPFPAKWNDLSHPDAVIKINKFGKKYDAVAGHRRNQQMAEYADSLLVIWNGKSTGSADMKKRMEKLNKKIFEEIVDA